MSSCYDLDICLPTGCDSGFGNDLARRLDKEGYHVFAGCLALEREGARALKAATSDRLKLVSIDVTDDFQVSQAVSFVKENIGDNGECSSRHTQYMISDNQPDPAENCHLNVKKLPKT